jgi:hypothetical protein
MKKITICPNCQTKTTIEGEPGQKKMVRCKKCGQKGMISFKKSTKSTPRKLPTPKKQQPAKPQKKKSKRRILLNIASIAIIFILLIIIFILFFNIAFEEINIEIIYVSIFIGVMIIKEITDDLIPNKLKTTFNIFISGLLLIFLLIVINKIIILISSQ